MPWVPKPDVFPTFSMSMLRQAGLFDDGHRGWIGYSFAGVQYIIRLLKLRRMIVVVSQQKRGFFFQEINLVEVSLRFGRRNYLQCLYNGRRCETLYLVGTVFASRAYLQKVWGGRKPWEMKDAAHQRGVARLIGSDAKGPARGENRAKLVAQVKPRAWVRIAAPDIARELDEAIEREKRARRRRSGLPAREDPLAMAQRLKSGQRVRSSVDRDTSEDFLRRYGSAAPSGPRLLDSAFVEDQPFLTVLALKQQNLLNPGYLSAWSLEWTDEVNLIVECHLFDPANAFLLVRSRYGDRPPQVLRLVGGASQSRWYLICPFTGERLAKAFFRDGLFGSAKGNRLIHRSQRMAVVPEEAI